jgi:hypothetical protein
MAKNFYGREKSSKENEMKEGRENIWHSTILHYFIEKNKETSNIFYFICFFVKKDH